MLHHPLEHNPHSTASSNNQTIRQFTLSRLLPVLKTSHKYPQLLFKASESQDSNNPLIHAMSQSSSSSAHSTTSTTRSSSYDSIPYTIGEASKSATTSHTVSSPQCCEETYSYMSGNFIPNGDFINSHFYEEKNGNQTSFFKRLFQS